MGSEGVRGNNRGARGNDGERGSEGEQRGERWGARRGEGASHLVKLSLPAF